MAQQSIGVIRRVLISGFVAGVVLSFLSYLSLYLAIRFIPFVFVDYINPLFISDGSRDIMFYLHAMIISMALAYLWEKLKTLFSGNFFQRGLKFGLLYGLTALIPIMWITYSTMEITLVMVASWVIYGIFQSVIAGIIFAKMNP